MVSVYTPNINLEEPARGDQVGTWDTPVNANMTLLDLVVGGTATIALAGAPVVLAAAQFQAKTIILNSTLTGNVVITFPTSYVKSYEILNNCTGSSNFFITLQTTVAGSAYVGVPHGEICEVVNIAGNIRFKNFGRIGTYWDYAGSSVPSWVSGSNPVPYLNCDGGTFSSASYPQLTTILGSTTLPDRRGTTGYTLNQGTGRLTVASGGLNGDVVSSVKTTQVTISTSNLPPYTPSGTNTGGAASYTFSGASFQSGTTAIAGVSIAAGGGTPSQFTQPTFTGNAQGGVSNVLPIGSATVTGICMIRAG